MKKAGAEVREALLKSVTEYESRKREEVVRSFFFGTFLIAIALMSLLIGVRLNSLLIGLAVLVLGIIVYKLIEWMTVA